MWMLLVSKDLALMEAEEQTHGEGGGQAWEKKLLASEIFNLGFSIVRKVRFYMLTKVGLK